MSKHLFPSSKKVFQWLFCAAGSALFVFACVLLVSYQDKPRYEFLHGGRPILSIYFISDDDLIAIMRDGGIFKISDKGKTEKLIANLNEYVVFTRQFSNSIFIATLSGKSVSIEHAPLTFTEEPLPEHLRLPLCISSDFSLWAVKSKENVIPIFLRNTETFQLKTNLVRVDRPRNAFFHNDNLIYDHFNGDRKGISITNFDKGTQTNKSVLESETVRCIASGDKLSEVSIVCGTEHGDIVIFDNKLKLIERVATGHWQLECLAVSSNKIIAISDGGVLCVYDFYSKRLSSIRLLRDISPAGVSLSPSGKFITVWTGGHWEDREGEGYALVYRIP